jgi:hypothetical protein|nr:MAG TPA: Prokaryotic membrane lipoprotein lipid attachment site [Caudoviricetes sp.]
MKKILLLALPFLVLSSCNGRKTQETMTSYDSLEAWKDSMRNNPEMLSFRGVKLGSYFENPSDSAVKDSFSIWYAENGRKWQEKNVWRSVYTFENKVYQIVVETDNYSVAELFSQTYRKRYGLTESMDKYFGDWSLPETNGTDEAGHIIFKYCSLYFIWKNNDIVIKTQYSMYPNPNKDYRFDGSSVYCVTLTDSILYNKHDIYERKMMELKEKNDERKMRDMNIQNKDINSELSNQF